MSEPGPLLGQGRRATVHGLSNGRVFKRFGPGVPPESIAREAAAQARARAAGLAVPRVHGVRTMEGATGIEMDAAPGPVLAEEMVLGAVPPEEALRRMLRLQLAIHACPGEGLPPLHLRLRERIAASGLPPGQRDGLLGQLAAQPEQARLCHGDFHPYNVLGPPGEEQVIDWADAASGTPLADACLTTILIAPHDEALALRYLDLYLAATGLARAEAAAWLPLLAAARLAEGQAAERAALLRLLEPGA